MAGKGAAPPAVVLSSGHRMPAVGLGVWRMEKPDIRGLIHSALRIGYRHLDCAGKASETPRT
jgi:aldehyde reductase